ncbi:MAG: hypothetical protein KC502_15640 [Myxococcales bacterium]|nr:hypothetical protein [Myxococcales bacterium]
MHQSKTLVQLAFMLVLAATLTACGPGYLDKGKRVVATSENKEIFNVLKAYHRAIEDRDVPTLKKMSSKRYYENGGTTDTDKDDYGVDRLRNEVLPRLKDNVKRVTFTIRLLAIRIDGKSAQADYEFVGRVLLTEGGRESYKAWRDFSQMKLIREAGYWKIARGM